MVLSRMLGAVSRRRAGSDHRAVCHAEWFSSLLASRAVTMVDGLPRAASFGQKYVKIDSKTNLEVIRLRVMPDELREHDHSISHRHARSTSHPVRSPGWRFTARCKYQVWENSVARERD